MDGLRTALVALACLGCLPLAGCGSSGQSPPALLVITPNPHAAVPPLPGTRLTCRPAPDGGPARSRLIFNGSCTFVETAAVQCVQRADDFYVYINRSLPGQAHLFVVINVEYYRHPGTYKGQVEVYLEVTRGLDVFAWEQRLATATVPPDLHHLILQPADAVPWGGTPARHIEHIGGTVTCRGLGH
ncbi:MAG: hypothetical protein JOZ41_12050 [Chloroflexi bacterium]|nr:hypothetical protein [Chloroflexota bacterium]